MNSSIVEYWWQLW